MYCMSTNQIKITKNVVKTYCYSQYKRNKKHKFITHISNLLTLRNLPYIFFPPKTYNLTFFFFISFQIIDLFIISTLSFFHLYFSYFNIITNYDISLTAGSGRCLCKTPKNKELTSMLLAHQKAITNNSQLSYLTNYTVSNLVEVNRCDLFFLSQSSDTPLSELFYNEIKTDVELRFDIDLAVSSVIYKI